jgi:hypothetical protein
MLKVTTSPVRSSPPAENMMEIYRLSLVEYGVDMKAVDGYSFQKEIFDRDTLTRITTAGITS